MFNKELFQPIHIGKLEVKNRIAMAPLNTGNLFPPNEGTIPQRVIDYYVERAKGGVGLIITGVFKVENEVENYQKHGVRVWQVLTNNALAGFAELAEYVHGFGAKIFVQLSAGPGRVARGDVIDAGFTPVSASANPAYYRPDITCRELTREEVEKIISAFGRAAEMLSATGVDGVEIHGHEGYLLDQFLTPLWNRRNDKYGGDPMRRLNIALEILKKVKKKAGTDFPVSFRLGIKHFIKGQWKAALQSGDFVETGRDIEGSIQMAGILEKAGYDALNVDAGCYESLYWAHPPIYQPDACYIDLLSHIKTVVNIPIMAAGKLGDPKVAEEALKKGAVDMIALGRPLLADPQWANKVSGGMENEIRPCIGCHEACFRLPAVQNKPMSCSVNPSCGREKLFPTIRSNDVKKVLVIGGGVAGMEAARTARKRGHAVVLFEKTDKLGGHLREACVPKFKKDLERLLKWYEGQMGLMNIELFLSNEINSEAIGDMDYDVAVLATGSIPYLPSIPGITKRNVPDCCAVLSGQSKTGEEVTVLGGGLNGCETALWLAQQGKSVSIVEVLDDIATKIHAANRQMLLDMIEDAGITVFTGAETLEVLEEGIIISNEKLQQQFLSCDTLISAGGFKPVNDLYGALINGNRPFHIIGDCREPRNIHHAIFDGFTVGNYI